MAHDHKEIPDKRGEPIRIGDEITPANPDETLTGVVADITQTKKEAKGRGVSDPPQVILEDDKSGEAVPQKPQNVVHANR
ncbi:hypothetical protein CPB86DRAFT_783527 [Serendipita vermifera]|nr:hypothetical protein CPB86DRAFT_783527 [Serendipita vermifera]